MLKITTTMHIRHSILPLSAATLLILGSCSLFHPAEKKSSAPQLIPLPTDREAVIPTKTRSTYTPEELSNGTVKGDWAIDSIYGKKAIGESAPFIKFDTDAKMIYGNNGCNTINASYKCNPADFTMSFSGMITTMRDCATPGISDYEINRALNDTKRYSWHIADTQYFLTLYSGTGQKLMTLMHQNFDFLNGTWLVVSIGPRDINVPGKELVPDMKLVIDIDEGKIHGNTGCNILNGAVTVDMELPNTLSFGKMATTRRMCPPDENYETDLLVALEDVYTARATSPETVDLINSHGEVVLRLKRCADK